MKRQARKGSAAPRPVNVVRVPFHGEELEAVREGVSVYAPIRRIAERFGVSAQGQIARLRAAPWACVKMILMQIPGDDQARAVACIPADAIPLWLATLQAGRVKPDVRPALDVFQAEAARVLREHFFGPGALEPATGPEAPRLPPAAAPEPPPAPPVKALPLPPSIFRGSALRRIDLAEGLADLCQEEIGSFVALRQADPQHYSDPFHRAIGEALLTVRHVFTGAEPARKDPIVAERYEKIRLRWKALMDAFKAL